MSTGTGHHDSEAMAPDGLEAEIAMLQRQLDAARQLLQVRSSQPQRVTATEHTAVTPQDAAFADATELQQEAPRLVDPRLAQPDAKIEAKPMEVEKPADNTTQGATASDTTAQAKGIKRKTPEPSP